VIDWAMALSTASQAIKLANDLRFIDKEMSQAELKLKVADLTSALADLKMTLTEAKGDASEKDSEIARLKRLQHRLEDETVELY
jgi:predicted  nucleic acid-binding Zn-ribbon protein